MEAFVGAAVILLSFGGISAVVASRRGHSPLVWYLLGSLGGPIGPAFAFSLEPQEGSIAARANAEG